MTDESVASPGSDEITRLLFAERFKADRTFEHELAKFSGDLERSFLQAAAVLNGGSATVFLSFLGSTADKTKANPYLISVSFVAWIVGLALAITTGWVAHKAQNGFLRATRNRRHVSGLQILGERYQASMSINSSDTIDSLSKLVEKLQSEANKNWSLAIKLGVGSVFLFVTGAVLALITVLSATAIHHAP